MEKTKFSFNKSQITCLQMKVRLVLVMHILIKENPKKQTEMEDNEASHKDDQCESCTYTC